MSTLPAEAAGYIAVPAPPRIYRSTAFGVPRWVVLADLNPFPRIRIWRIRR